VFEVDGGDRQLALFLGGQSEEELLFQAIVVIASLIPSIFGHDASIDGEG